MQNNQKELILLKDLGMHYPNETSNKKYRYGIYRCHCSNEFKTDCRSVKRKRTKSCGCSRFTHNLTSHRLYNTWSNMIRRCNSINHERYMDYGARGITVCERWLNIANFIEDMYPTFKEGLTLDRENVNGSYEPSNCRWVTDNIQARNTQMLRRDNTSGYRGVHINKKDKKYITQIRVDKENIYLGYFKNKIDAAKAYNQYVIDNNLEHTLNIIEEN